MNKELFRCGATDAVTFNGKAYGVTFASKMNNVLGVFYNKDLIAKYAPETDIAKLYKEKHWTFDTFRILAQRCTHDTDGDGKMDVYGVTSNTNINAMAMTANAGGIALMKNGRVEATMCNDAGIAALEWCKSLYKNDKTWKYYADINNCVDAFANGNAAMLATYMSYYPNIASKANFDYGFVLMPMGPDQTDYINNVYDARLYVVPKTKEHRLGDIGVWLNAVGDVSDAFTEQQVSELQQAGFDETAIDCYQYAVNTMAADFATGAFSGAIASQVDNCVFSASQHPSKVMPSIKDKAQQELDDFYGPMYE